MFSTCVNIRIIVWIKIFYSGDRNEGTNFLQVRNEGSENVFAPFTMPICLLSAYILCRNQRITEPTFMRLYFVKIY